MIAFYPNKNLFENKIFILLFRHFTYATTHSPTLPSLYQRHNSFSNPSVTSPTSEFIPQPFIRFSYVTSSSLISPGEPHMLPAPLAKPIGPSQKSVLENLRSEDPESASPGHSQKILFLRAFSIS